MAAGEDGRTKGDQCTRIYSNPYIIKLPFHSNDVNNEAYNNSTCIATYGRVQHLLPLVEILNMAS